MAGRLVVGGRAVRDVELAIGPKGDAVVLVLACGVQVGDDHRRIVGNIPGAGTQHRDAVVAGDVKLAAAKGESEGAEEAARVGPAAVGPPVVVGGPAGA